MPRTARVAPGGMIYQVINRGLGKLQLFFNDEDYLAFGRAIVETLKKREMRRRRKLDQSLFIPSSLYSVYSLFVLSNERTLRG